MEIRAIDPSDADELRRFYDVSYRAEMADGRDWNGHWTYDEVASMLLDATPEDRSAGLAVYDGDRLVGSGVMSWSDVDNTDKCFVFPMVDPPERGRGVGSALLEAMVDDCRARGRTTVTSSTAYAGPERDDAPAVRFAAKHGFQVANTEIHRHLDLPVPDALLDEVDAEGAAYREGYTIETFVGEVPEELLASYCDLLNQLIVDAPSGEVDYESGAHPRKPARADGRAAKDRPAGLLLGRGPRRRRGGAVRPRIADRGRHRGAVGHLRAP
jgi:GNAT superfamily N-acetyltransferase